MKTSDMTEASQLNHPARLLLWTFSVGNLSWVLSHEGSAFGVALSVFPQTSNHHGSNSSQCLDSSHGFGANLTALEDEKQSRAEVSQDRESKACSGDTATSPMMRRPPQGMDSVFQRWGGRGKGRGTRYANSNQRWADHGSRCSRYRKEVARRQVSKLQTANFEQTGRITAWRMTLACYNPATC